MNGTTNLGPHRPTRKTDPPELLGDAMRRLAFEAENPALRSVLREGLWIGTTSRPRRSLQDTEVKERTRCGRHPRGLAERTRRQDAGEPVIHLAS